MSKRSVRVHSTRRASLALWQPSSQPPTPAFQDVPLLIGGPFSQTACIQPAVRCGLADQGAALGTEDFYHFVNGRFLIECANTLDPVEPLPQGWCKATTDDGTPYYVKSVLSSPTRPPHMAPSHGPLMAPSHGPLTWPPGYHAIEP